MQAPPSVGRGRGAAPILQQYGYAPQPAPVHYPAPVRSPVRGLPSLEQWLPAIGFADYVGAFYENGFESVEMLLEFAPQDWDELAYALQFPLGHKMKLRREIEKLRM